jgi:hypothetical protein
MRLSLEDYANASSVPSLRSLRSLAVNKPNSEIKVKGGCHAEAQRRGCWKWNILLLLKFVLLRAAASLRELLFLG